MKRYGKALEVFDMIDPYYNHTNIHEAVEHAKKWYNFRCSDAALTEKFRQESIRLKIQLLMSGVSDEAIKNSDWSDRVMGINSIDAVVSQGIGQEVIDYIRSARLLESSNGAEQVRCFILEKLFYQESHNA